MTSQDVVLRILQRYVAAPTARGMVRRAAADSSFGAGDPGVGKLVEALRPGIRTFVRDARRTQLLSELERAREERAPTPRHMDVAVNNEHDARRARMLARTMAMEAGASSLVALRAATGVSELVRNMLLYAGRGHVDISIRPDPSPSIRIVASDTGPGIADLDLVMSGGYRSRTGLGQGLLGTKKVADRFHIDTGPNGTRVEFELDL